MCVIEIRLRCRNHTLGCFELPVVHIEPQSGCNLKKSCCTKQDKYPCLVNLIIRGCIWLDICKCGYVWSCKHTQTDLKTAPLRRRPQPRATLRLYMPECVLYHTEAGSRQSDSTSQRNPGPQTCVRDHICARVRQCTYVNW